jgi:hypothetical protein
MSKLSQCNILKNPGPLQWETIFYHHIPWLNNDPLSTFWDCFFNIQSHFPHSQPKPCNTILKWDSIWRQKIWYTSKDLYQNYLEHCSWCEVGCTHLRRWLYSHVQPTSLYYTDTPQSNGLAHNSILQSALAPLMSRRWEHKKSVK